MGLNRSYGISTPCQCAYNLTDIVNCRSVGAYNDPIFRWLAFMADSIQFLASLHPSSRIPAYVPIPIDNYELLGKIYIRVSGHQLPAWMHQCWVSIRLLATFWMRWNRWMTVSHISFRQPIPSFIDVHSIRHDATPKLSMPGRDICRANDIHATNWRRFSNEDWVRPFYSSVKFCTTTKCFLCAGLKLDGSLVKLSVSI